MRRRDFLRAAAASAIAACAPTNTTPGPTGDVVSGMSLERKVGQLMSVAFHGTKITSSLEAMIRDRGVGGVILYSENFTDAAGLAKLVSDLDRIARDAKSLPLFFEIDQEGGPVFRTQGDASAQPDARAFELDAPTQARYRFAIPLLGWVFVVLASRPARLFLLALPMLVIALVLAARPRRAGGRLASEQGAL